MNKWKKNIYNQYLTHELMLWRAWLWKNQQTDWIPFDHPSSMQRGVHSCGTLQPSWNHCSSRGLCPLWTLRGLCEGSSSHKKYASWVSRFNIFLLLSRLRMESGMRWMTLRLARSPWRQLSALKHMCYFMFDLILHQYQTLHRHCMLPILKNMTLWKLRAKN